MESNTSTHDVAPLVTSSPTNTPSGDHSGCANARYVNSVGSPTGTLDSTISRPAEDPAGKIHRPSAAVSARRLPSGDHAGSQAPTPALSLRKSDAWPAQTAVAMMVRAPRFTTFSAVFAQSASLVPNWS